MYTRYFSILLLLSSLLVLSAQPSLSEESELTPSFLRLFHSDIKNTLVPLSFPLYTFLFFIRKYILIYLGYVRSSVEAYVNIIFTLSLLPLTREWTFLVCLIGSVILYLITFGVMSLIINSILFALIYYSQRGFFYAFTRFYANICKAFAKSFSITGSRLYRAIAVIFFCSVISSIISILMTVLQIISREVFLFITPYELIRLIGLQSIQMTNYEQHSILIPVEVESLISLLESPQQSQNNISINKEERMEVSAVTLETPSEKKCCCKHKNSTLETSEIITQGVDSGAVTPISVALAVGSFFILLVQIF